MINRGLHGQCKTKSHQRDATTPHFSLTLQNCDYSHYFMNRIDRNSRHTLINHRAKQNKNNIVEWQQEIMTIPGPLN